MQRFSIFIHHPVYRKAYSVPTTSSVGTPLVPLEQFARWYPVKKVAKTLSTKPTFSIMETLKNTIKKTP